MWKAVTIQYLPSVVCVDCIIINKRLHLQSYQIATVALRIIDILLYLNTRFWVSHAWMNEWTNEWMNEWTNEWMNELMDVNDLVHFHIFWNHLGQWLRASEIKSPLLKGVASLFHSGFWTPNFRLADGRLRLIDKPSFSRRTVSSLTQTLTCTCRYSLFFFHLIIFLFNWIIFTGEL